MVSIALNWDLTLHIFLHCGIETMQSNASVSLLNTRGSSWPLQLPVHPAVEKSSQWPDLRGMSAFVQSDGCREGVPTPQRAQRWIDSLSHLQPFPLKLQLSRSGAAIWQSSYVWDSNRVPTCHISLMFVHKRMAQTWKSSFECRIAYFGKPFFQCSKMDNSFYSLDLTWQSPYSLIK